MGGASRRCDPGAREPVPIHAGRGIRARTYSAEEIDAVGVFCDDLHECFLIPIELVGPQGSISLRIAPPRNSQRASVHWAPDHQLPGAVAQLGERCRGTAEGTGSSPVSSTPQTDDHSEIVGAHQFRNHFGYWMERAAAGEEILITRHGRRFTRLGPADESLLPPSSD